MENKTCIYCEKEYTPKGSSQKVCGDFLCKVRLREATMKRNKAKARAKYAEIKKRTGTVSRDSIYNDDGTFS